MEASLVLNKTNLNEITLDDLKQVPLPKFSKLNLNDILDSIPAENLITQLFEIKSKLLPNGIISIQGYDLYELSYSIINDQIQTIEYNNLIKDKKQLLCVPDLTFILNKLGFKILIRDVDANKYYIEAQNG